VAPPQAGARDTAPPRKPGQLVRRLSEGRGWGAANPGVAGCHRRSGSRIAAGAAGRGCWRGSACARAHGARIPGAPRPAPQVGTGPGVGNGYEILLQGFNWESHKRQ
jgi:hypothetical protein